MKQLRVILLGVIFLLGMNTLAAEELAATSPSKDIYGLDDPKGIRMSYRTVADLPQNEFVEVKIQDGKMFLAAQEKSGKRKSKGRKISDEEIRKVAEYYQKIDFFEYAEPATPVEADSSGQPQKERMRQLEYGYGDQSKQLINPDFIQPEYAELLAWYGERVKEFLAEAYPNSQGR